MNGSSESEGRVEMYKDGEWGTICDEGWGANDATVVCSALGFTGSSEGIQGAYFTEGSGPIRMTDVACEGSEGSLEQCSHNPASECTHASDAGVKCNLTDSTGKI